MMVFKSSESPGLPPSTTLITSCPCPRTTPEQTDSKVYSSVKKSVLCRLSEALHQTQVFQRDTEVTPSTQTLELYSIFIKHA